MQLYAMLPILRYSYERGAYILRFVGENRGPVLRKDRRRGQSAYRSPERRAVTVTPLIDPAQAETLAIVAYLQPVSRPEIARIRGVSAESAAATLLERGIIEEAGRSQFGAVLYRTTDLFLKLFGLAEIAALPEIAGFDPSPELEQELRERLLRAGEARAGVSDAAAAVVAGRAGGDE
ncbi:MAG: SMC-Scp complex subunit ScpB [Solirubrobacteraceae bacterium]